MKSIYDEIVPVAPVTVLGIGNIILRDEGFGVRAMEYLEEHYSFPQEVRLLDGGTLGPELLHFVTGTEKLLILDAVAGDAAPGTVYRFEIGIQDVLAWLTVTGRSIPNVVVLGMQPYELTAGLTLSPEMAAALPSFAHRAVEELVRFGVIPKERSVPRRQTA